MSAGKADITGPAADVNLMVSLRENSLNGRLGTKSSFEDDEHADLTWIISQNLWTSLQLEYLASSPTTTSLAFLLSCLLTASEIPLGDNLKTLNLVQFQYSLSNIHWACSLQGYWFLTASEIPAGDNVKSLNLVPFQYSLSNTHWAYSLQGYANPGQLAAGIHTRLYARAFLIADRNNSKYDLLCCHYTGYPTMLVIDIIWIPFGREYSFSTLRHNKHLQSHQLHIFGYYTSLHSITLILRTTKRHSPSLIQQSSTPLLYLNFIPAKRDCSNGLATR